MPIKFYVATGETALLYVTVHHSCGHLRTEATSACCILTLSLQPDACVCDAWALLSSTEPFRMVQVGQSLACFLDTGARDSSKCDKGFLDLILSSTFWKPAQDLLRQAAASGARGNLQVRVRYPRVGAEPQHERPMELLCIPISASEHLPASMLVLLRSLRQEQSATATRPISSKSNDAPAPQIRGMGYLHPIAVDASRLGSSQHELHPFRPGPLSFQTEAAAASPRLSPARLRAAIAAAHKWMEPAARPVTDQAYCRRLRRRLSRGDASVAVAAAPADIVAAAAPDNSPAASLVQPRPFDGAISNPLLRGGGQRSQRSTIPSAEEISNPLRRGPAAAPPAPSESIPPFSPAAGTYPYGSLPRPLCLRPAPLPPPGAGGQRFGVGPADPPGGSGAGDCSEGERRGTAGEWWEGLLIEPPDE